MQLKIAYTEDLETDYQLFLEKKFHPKEDFLPTTIQQKNHNQKTANLQLWALSKLN